MDILGAIALCTEPPASNNSVHTTCRISRRDKVMQPTMWRQIFTQSAYQLLVMLILMYFGTFIFFSESFNIVSQEDRDLQGNPNSRLVLNTIMFYTFILMTLFNQINCRVHDSEDINCFKGILVNPFFLIVTISEFLVTFLMVRGGSSHLTGSLFGTAPITTGQSVVCWILGALSLVVNVASKRIPTAPFLKLTNKFDLETEKSDELVNRFMEKAKGKYSEQVNSFIDQKHNQYKNSLIEQDADDYQREN